MDKFLKAIEDISGSRMDDQNLTAFCSPDDQVISESPDQHHTLELSDTIPISPYKHLVNKNFTISLDEEFIKVPIKEYLIIAHMMKKRQLMKELNALIYDVNLNSLHPYYVGLVQANYAHLEELDNQLQVYENVMARVQDDNHLKKREMFRFSNCHHPIFGKRSEIDMWISEFSTDYRYIIVQGPSGSGKSTQLSQYIADHPRMYGKKIISVQPREISAITLAERVSLEYSYGNPEFSSQVNYSIGESKAENFEELKIEFTTLERMLKRVMNRQKEDFANVGAIIIDEAHERSIICDVLLGMLKKNDPLWNNILIVVSLANADLKDFVNFFEGKARIIEINPKMYPIYRIFKPPPEIKVMANSDLGVDWEIVKAVGKAALEIHISVGKESGDILCFLPGADEVHQAALWFENHLNFTEDRLTPKVYKLYDNQELEEYKNVFETLDSTLYRKIIFATDIAETSISINSVVYVVDSGARKDLIFDPIRNISTFRTTYISRWSSLERGRQSCRSQPGVCYKLYSEEIFCNMNWVTRPEISQLPIYLVIIYLRKNGINPGESDWISGFDPIAAKSAEEELIMLGAVEEGRPTVLGELIYQTRQEPKKVRMIYKGMLRGFGMAAIKIAALMSLAHGDVITMLKLYNEYKSFETEDDFITVKKKRLEWLRNNSLSAETLSTVDSTVRELKYIFSLTEFWTLKSQNSVPNDEEILQLICSGYFLHAARRVYTKNENQDQVNYFAVKPELTGTLRNGESYELSDWILFDQILKFSGIIIFPLTNRIDPIWIKNENPDFYLKCLEKSNNLPTEIVEVKASESVIKAFRDKHLNNFGAIHAKINFVCFDGLIRAYCSKNSIISVENFLKNEIKLIENFIHNKTIYRTWRANTRLIIGPGYEITSILFPGEFDTFHINNLPWNCSREWLEDFIYDKIDHLEKISSLQLVSNDTTWTASKDTVRRLSKGTSSCTAILKFFNSSDASEIFNKLKFELDAFGGEITLSPHFEFQDPGIVSGVENVRLKISWPLGPSIGVANIIFKDFKDGNKALDLLPDHFKGVKASPYGELNNIDLTRRLPRIKWMDGGWRFVESEKFQDQLVYKIRAENLSPYVDEVQISEFLYGHGITPIRVVVERKEPELPPVAPLSYSEERDLKLAPLRSIFGTHSDLVTVDFYDQPAFRAGIHVHFEDTFLVDNVYNQIKQEYIDWIDHAQPHRVEPEWRYKLTVRKDLYGRLKGGFTKALTEIRKMILDVSESGCGKKDKSRIVSINLCHHDFELVRRCRRMLEAVVEREYLDLRTSPNVRNLLEKTGKIMVQEVSSEVPGCFIYADPENGYFYVYGVNSSVRERAKEKLSEIIDKIENWKQNGIFEKTILLNKEVLKNYVNFIGPLCRAQKFLKGQYHFAEENKLVLSTCNRVKYEVIVRELKMRGLIMPDVDETPVVLRYCGVCLDYVDKDFMITSLCDHAFCITCIENMFKSAARGAGVQEIPVCCPADGCARILPIQDIQKALPDIAISKLTETALNNYLNQNDISIQYCPNPGCNQIFRRTDTIGPNFYVCDNCRNDFCLNCTEFLKKPTGAHRNQLCEPDRAREEDLIREYTNLIRDEILCLHCPRCQHTFFDYDACAALTCINSSCQATFCALCLKDCGKNSHRHVKKCRFNGTKLLYVDLKKVNEANRLYRIDRLSRFLKNLEAQDISDFKSKLLNALERDLNDLGIQIQEVLDAKDDFGVSDSDSSSATSSNPSTSGSSSSDSVSSDSSSDSDSGTDTESE